MTTRSIFVLGAVALVCSVAACSEHSSPSSPLGLSPSLSGGSTGGGGSVSGGGGGGTKPSCTNALSVTATASEALSGNAFTAQYVLTSCQSKTHVGITVTDLTTGAVVWSSPDLLGLVAVWTLPYTLTTYRVDARATAGSTNTVVATASTTVSTLDPIPCTVTVNENATVGYYLTYPAVWAATDVQDCGQGGSVHLQITNLNSGQVELDYPGLGLSSFIDFEGAMVSYNTPYRVYAEYRSSTGELLGSSTKDIVSSPLK